MALVDHTATTTAGSVVADLSDAATTPFGAYFACPGDPLADEARALEKQVFFETFGNAPDLLEAEYGLFQDVSIFVVVLDHERAKVAGMVRLIFDGRGSLKSLDDIEGEPWSRPLTETLAETGIGHLDTSESIDITTLAVDPDYRGAASSGLVSLALYQGLVGLTVATDTKWLVTILDVIVLDLLQNTVGRPFDYYAGVDPKRYLDSPSSVPVWCDVTDYGSRLAERDPGLWEILFSGSGIETAVSPPDYQRAAAVAEQLRSSTVLDLR